MHVRRAATTRCLFVRRGRVYISRLPMTTGSAAPDWRASLRGRATECARLEGLVGDVRRGQGRSLVLLGEAGIGKTALLDYLIGVASDVTVLASARAASWLLRSRAPRRS
jgi:hypothetical protein